MDNKEVAYSGNALLDSINRGRANNVNGKIDLNDFEGEIVLVSPASPGKSTNALFDLVQNHNSIIANGGYKSEPLSISGIGDFEGDRVSGIARQAGKTITTTNVLLATRSRQINAELARLAIRSYGNKKRFGRTAPSIRFATTLDDKRIRMRKSESKRFLRWSSL